MTLSQIQPGGCTSPEPTQTTDLDLHEADDPHVASVSGMSETRLAAIATMCWGLGKVIDVAGFGAWALAPWSLGILVGGLAASRDAMRGPGLIGLIAGLGSGLHFIKMLRQLW